MADKMKRVLLLFWHMMWPLLLYEAAGTLVRAEFAVMFPEKEPEQLALPAMGVTAAAACVFLGRWYQEQRSRSQSRGEKRKKDDFLLFVLASAAGAGACLLFNSLLLSIPGMKNGAEEVSRLIYRPPSGGSASLYGACDSSGGGAVVPGCGIRESPQGNVCFRCGGSFRSLVCLVSWKSGSGSLCVFDRTLSGISV